MGGRFGRAAVGTERSADLAFLGACDAGQSVGVDFAQLVADAVGGVVLLSLDLSLHRLSHGREISCLFELFDRGEPVCRKPDVPQREASQDQAKDAGNDSQENVVDWHDALRVPSVA